MLIWKGLAPSRLASVLAWLMRVCRGRDVSSGASSAGYSYVASPSIKD